MSRPFSRWTTPSLGLLCLLIAACASDPEPAPLGPLDEPVDAFEAVGEPAARPGGAPARDSDNLSTDIERLQNARETYRQAQQRRRVETQRRQAECRAEPDSREVAIDDGSDDPNATYCKSADEP